MTHHQIAGRMNALVPKFQKALDEGRAVEAAEIAIEIKAYAELGKREAYRIAEALYGF